MTHVLTLIANPATPCLSEQTVTTLSRQFELGLIAGPTDWLADRVAVDLPISTPVDPAPMRRWLAEKGLSVDIVCQPTEGREKRLLIADMDSTIIEQECLDELADFAGCKAEIAAVTERAMNGELDFEEALTARVARLEGLSADALDETLRTRIALTPGARTLVQTMNQRGAVTALVSGGFTWFTQRVAELSGFQHHRGNELEIREERLTGRVVPPILGRAAKRQALEEIAAASDLTPTDAIAVGDGANDLAMLKAAGAGVAFRAKPTVAAAADHQIDHGDLTALLYLQGIRTSDFVG